VGVLLTRGNPTILYPEQLLTFRVETPVTVSTERSMQAFRYVEPEDYNGPGDYNAGPMARRPPPYPPYYAYPYPRYYSGYFWGPGFYYGGSIYIRGGHRRFR
jgi:hypothetical protein